MSTEQRISLYEEDETAWLEQTSALVRQQRWSEIDTDNLSEFLCDMAKRDRRETLSRLVTLLVHLLKWQADQRTRSWRGTIMEQQRALEMLLESGTLRRHADEVFAKAYTQAKRQAVADTGLDAGTFPVEPPWSLEQAVMTDITAGQ